MYDASQPIDPANRYLDSRDIAARIDWLQEKRDAPQWEVTREYPPGLVAESTYFEDWGDARDFILDAFRHEEGNAADNARASLAFGPAETKICDLTVDGQRWSLVRVSDRSGILNFDEESEMRSLLEVEQAQRGCGDWGDGTLLINAAAFEEYAQAFAEECGYITHDAAWPHRHIDWKAAADELRHDYSEVDVLGTPFLVRV